MWVVETFETKTYCTYIKGRYRHIRRLLKKRKITTHEEVNLIGGFNEARVYMVIHGLH